MNSCKRGKLVIFSAPSGTGKGTVVKALMERRSDVFLSVSWTTRLPREGEIDGVHYHFRSEEEFAALAESGGFLEHAGVFDRRYGTPARAVMENIAAGRFVILEIDVQGALQVMEKVNKADVLSIFLLPPGMGELRRRLEHRGTETKERINRRFATAYDELKAAHNYEYCVVNDDIAAAAEAVSNILDGIAAANYQTSNYTSFIKKLQEEKI